MGVSLPAAVSIDYSVGQGGVNRVPDVVKVQGLLNRVKAQWQVPASEQLTVDGLVGPKTIASIKDFQKYFVPELKVADGRVDPNRLTILKLNVMASYLPHLNDGVSYLQPESAPPFLA